MTTSGWGLESDQSGRFAFRELPNHFQVSIEASAGGFAGYRTEVRLPLEAPLRIVLRPDVSQPELRGVVRDSEGNVIVDAVAFVGSRMARSDHNGEFSLRMRGTDPVDRLLVGKVGFQPRELRDLDPTLRHEIVLVGPDLSIQGRLESSGDMNFEEVEIALEDATWPEASDVSLETAIAAGGLSVKPDSYGSFEIKGLGDRSYRLRMWHGPSLHLQVSEPIEAGASGVRIRFDRDQLIPEIEGQVRNRHGEALVGIEVQLRIVTQRYPFGWDSRSKPVATTDGQGYFTVEGVPYADADLIFSGTDVVKREVKIEDPDERLEVTLTTQGRFSVRTGFVADSFRVLNEDGLALQVAQSVENTDGAPKQITTTAVPLEDGRSGSCQVSDDAEIIVFFDDEREVRRFELTLAVGDNGLLDF